MTAAYIALLIGALSASWVSRINLRGILWLLASQVAFWLSVLYWDLFLPLPFLIAAIFDSLIVYYIFKYGEEKWEEWLMLIFTGSILINFVGQALTAIDINFNIYAYSWSLYIINWIAIILIGTISGLKDLNYDRTSIPFSNWSSFLGVTRLMDKEKGG
jgi:hypothetical protein